MYKIIYTINHILIVVFFWTHLNKNPPHKTPYYYPNDILNLWVLCSQHCITSHLLRRQYHRVTETIAHRRVPYRRKRHTNFDLLQHQNNGTRRPSSQTWYCRGIVWILGAERGTTKDIYESELIRTSRQSLTAKGTGYSWYQRGRVVLPLWGFKWFLLQVGVDSYHFKIPTNVTLLFCTYTECYIILCAGF